jgi:hypothetical protein
MHTATVQPSGRAAIIRCFVTGFTGDFLPYRRPTLLPCPGDQAIDAAAEVATRMSGLKLITAGNPGDHRPHPRGRRIKGGASWV